MTMHGGSRPAAIGAALLVVVLATGACASGRAETEPCVFPGQSSSVIVEDMASGPDSALVVRVVDASLRPIRGALVGLNSNRYGGSADDHGVIRLEGVPRGRYEIRVLSIGYRTAMDSITYSEFGTDVAVVLVQSYRGLLACFRPAG